MRTNIEIDDKLMKDALKATGVKTKRELYRSCWSVLRGGGLRPSLALRQAAEPKWGSVRHRLCSPCPGRAKRLAASAAPSSSWAVRPLAASAPTVLGRFGALVPVRCAGAAIRQLEKASSSFALCGEEKPIQNTARSLFLALARRLLEGVWSNPSIERTSPGKPGAASHVKR